MPWLLCVMNVHVRPEKGITKLFKWLKRKKGHQAASSVGPGPDAVRWEEAEWIYKEALEQYHGGKIEAALAKFERARVVAHDLGKVGPEAAAQRDIGVCHEALCQTEQALRAYRESLELFRRINNDSEAAGVLGNMALTFRRIKDWQSAGSCLDDVAAISRRAGRSIDEAKALNDAAACLNDWGRPDNALEHLQQALAILRPLGMRRDIAIVLNNKCIAHRQRGELTLAKQCYDESREIFSELAQKPGSFSQTPNESSR